MAERLINIGKIVRNTTKMNVENGQMEEIVNLRQEDGRLQPLSPNVEIWQNLFDQLPQYSFLFLHTGKTYKHLLGIDKDTLRVHYLGNIVDDDVTGVSEATKTETEVVGQVDPQVNVWSSSETGTKGQVRTYGSKYQYTFSTSQIIINEEGVGEPQLVIGIRQISGNEINSYITDPELNIRNLFAISTKGDTTSTQIAPIGVDWEVTKTEDNYIELTVTFSSYKYAINAVAPLFINQITDYTQNAAYFIEFKLKEVTTITPIDVTEQLTTVQKPQIQVYQVGNLLILNDAERVQYLQWKNDSAYELVNIDYNGNTWSDTLSPLGGIKVRVKPTCNDLGAPTILLANGDLSENNNSNNWTGAGFTEATAASNGLSVIAQAKKIAKELGLLNGFQIGVVALELYDGSYAYTGAPFIIPQANDDGTRYTTTRGQETTTDCSSESETQALLNSAGYGAVLSTPFKYRTNPKGMELVRPTVNWFGLQSVNSQYKKVGSVVERFPISIGYDTRAQLKYGNIDINGSSSNESGSSQYAKLDLFGLETKSAIEMSEEEENTCAPFVFNLYDYNGNNNWDSTEYASNRAITPRSCSCIEDVNPIGITGNAFDGDYREYGADCFNPPNAYSIMGTIKEHRSDSVLQWHLSSQERPNSKECCWGALMTQGLQIKFDSAINENLSDIVKNICLFISSEVYLTDESTAVAQCVKTYAMRCWGSAHKNRQVQHNGYTVYGTPKTDSKIKEQLENTQVLYKAYTTPYKNIKANEWIDIDLSDKLNILEESETLNIDSSYQRNGIKAECAYLYNGRLHLGNLTETSFSGYPISEMEIPKQWQLNAFSLFSRCANYADCGDKSGSFIVLDYIVDPTRLFDDYGVVDWIGDGVENLFSGLEHDTTYNFVGRKDGGMIWFRDVSGTTTWVFTITNNDGKTIYPIAHANDGYSVYSDGVEYSASRCVLVKGITLKANTYEALVDNYYIVSVGSNGKAKIVVDSNVTDGSNIFEVSPNGSFSWNNTTYTAAESYYILLEKSDGTTEYKYAKKRSDSSFDNVRNQIGEDDSNSVSLYYESKNRFLNLLLSRYQSDERFTYPVCKQWDREEYSTDNTVYILVDIETQEGTYTVGRLSNKGTYYPLNPMISYPSSQAIRMRIGEIKSISGNTINVEESVFELKPFTAMESGVFISGDIKPILWWQDASIRSESKTDKWNNILNSQDYYHHTTSYTVGTDDCPFVIANGVVTDIQSSYQQFRPNVMKVSSTENPLFFPAANTYQVGNGEIRAFCSNTVALSTGQWGDAPLYVFCSDGIYGLFVDDSGEMVYPNSRPISREVCNNAIGVTPIDDAVVYSSKRGLFMLSGSTNTEVSQPCEGAPLQFADKSDPDYLNYMEYFIGKEENTSWLNMPNMPTDTDFKEYIKDACCGWNYKHTELWVANPAYDYTYIYSQGGWSKVMRQIDYFINDYPRTYFVGTDSNGDKRVWDLEENTEDPTDCFFVSRPIVVDGEMSKTFTRAWAYGDFNVEPNGETDPIKKHKATIIVYGSQDGTRYSMIGIGGVQGDTRNIVAKLHRMNMRYIRIAFVGRLKYDSVLECLGIEVKQQWGVESATKTR